VLLASLISLWLPFPSDAGARLRVVVDEVLAVELAQPVQGERWPGAVAQQPLTPGAVSSRDAHRAVDGNEVSVQANAGFIGVKRSGRNQNPPPCCHCAIARASSSGSTPRRTQVREPSACACACTCTWALASNPVAALKMTPSVGGGVEHAVDEEQGLADPPDPHEGPAPEP